jgi:hypothetical protein
MPRIAKTTKSRRLNLETSEPVRERLEHLRERTDADSLAEVIRRALAVYDFLWSEREKGGRIVVKDDQGGEREVVLL